MNSTTTIGAALAAAREQLQTHTSTPSLDSQTLMSHVTGQPRGWLLAHPEVALTEELLSEFRSGVERIREGMALPYVLGWWEFFGRRFQVSASVMIPRPETELLVEQALHAARHRDDVRSVLDLGTGSGCIAVTLALELEQVRLVASDISRQALQQAKENALEYGVESRVHLVQANLLEGFGPEFDLLCANLPYVPEDLLPALEVGRREPKVALDGGPRGMAAVEETLTGLGRVVKPGGLALLEIDASQGEQVLELAREVAAIAETQIIQDLAGRDRLSRVKLT